MTAAAEPAPESPEAPGDRRTGERSAAAAAPPGKHCPVCGERYPDDYAVCPRDATPLARTGAGGDPLLGKILGETYEVLRALGEGGMGRVYEVRHVRLGRKFALKTLHPQFAADPESVARFRREATAAAAVLSPHVATVFDVDATPEGGPYIVSELLEGEELADALHREGALEVSRAVIVARQVCAGLAAVHAAGIVHRDLKPENIMLVRGADGRETIKLLDFGIAKTLTESASLTRTGAVLGTPAYMAPEQARASGSIDARADVYALGAVLYRMLTGRAPFAGDDAGSTLASVLYDEPERPRTLRRDLPAGLELVVQRAMAKDPAQRYGSAQELDAALAEFAAGGAADVSAVGAVSASAGTGAGPVRSAVAEVAATVALPPGAAGRDAARAGSARARALGYGLLALAWAGAAVAALVGATVRAMSSRPPAAGESVLAGVLAAAAVLPIGALWARALRRGAWRNTATMLAHGDALARLALASLGAYAAVSLAWRGGEALVLHAAVPSPWSEAAALSASLAAALGLALRARRTLG